MAKITLTDIVAGYQLKEAYNANNDAIATAMENTLSRDGTGPNSMDADLDMDSNRILNLPAPASDNEPARKVDLEAAVGIDTDDFYAKADGVPYADLTGVPSAFAPTSHTHLYTEINGLGTNRLLGRSTAGSGDVEALTVGTGLQLTAGGLQVHNIPWSNLTSVPNFATRWPTWTEVTDKPTAFTPSAHTHTESEITDLQAYALDNVVVKLSGDQTVAGQKTFTSYQETRTAGSANDLYYRTDNAFDEKLWSVEVNAASMQLVSRGDAYSIGHVGLSLRRSGNTIPGVDLYAAGTVALSTQAPATGDNTTGATVRHADGSDYDVGMNVTPSVLANANTTFARAHVGKLLHKGDASAYTWTTPGSTDTTIPDGAVINLACSSSPGVTIAAGSGVTIHWFTGTTLTSGASRTLGVGGMAKIYRDNASNWWIWGTGIS